LLTFQERNVQTFLSKLRTCDGEFPHLD